MFYFYSFHDSTCTYIYTVFSLHNHSIRALLSTINYRYSFILQSSILSWINTLLPLFIHKHNLIRTRHLYTLSFHIHTYDAYIFWISPYVFNHIYTYYFPCNSSISSITIIYLMYHYHGCSYRITHI